MKRVCGVLVVLTMTLLAQPRDANALFRQKTTRLWGDSAQGAVVPVCYTAKLASQSRFSYFLPIFRNAVAQAWSRAANITFTGWTQCPAALPAATVVMDYVVYGFNAAIGKPASGPTVFPIDFNIKNDANDTPERWAYFAGHEFGHILGFEHEMDRFDNPYFSDHETGCPTTATAIPSGSLVASTPYDAESIMSYCGGESYWDPALGGYAAQLSAYDVIGAVATYGKKPANSLIGIDGKALTASSAAQTAYAMTPGNWGTLQRWYRSGNKFFDPYFHNITISSGFLDYVMSGSAPPSGLDLYQKNQEWIMMGNKCIGAANANANTVLTIQGCGTRQFELWDLDQVNNRVQLSGTNMCVNIPWGSATTGNVVQLYPCQSPPASNEKFTFNSNDIRFGGLCFNVAWGTPVDGNWLQLYPCAGGINEVYHFRGRITRADGSCMQSSTLAYFGPCLNDSDPTSSMTWDRWF
jgi:hypothetical protein